MLAVRDIWLWRKRGWTSEGRKCCEHRPMGGDAVNHVPPQPAKILRGQLDGYKRKMIGYNSTGNFRRVQLSEYKNRASVLQATNYVQGGCNWSTIHLGTTLARSKWGHWWNGLWGVAKAAKWKVDGAATVSEAGACGTRGVSLSF